MPPPPSGPVQGPLSSPGLHKSRAAPVTFDLLLIYDGGEVVLMMKKIKEGKQGLCFQALRFNLS